MAETSMYERGLGPNAANYAAMTPCDFVERSAATFPDKLAIIHGPLRVTYREFRDRCRALCSALGRRGIAKGDVVAVLAPNTPAMLEAHYGVPMAGAVLNAINTRLDAPTIAFILEHGGAKLVIVDRELAPVMADAIAQTENPPPVVTIDDPLADGGVMIGDTDYEALLAEGDATADWVRPADEWDSMSLNYTSGTTGNPKGVVFSHRGAFLNAMGNVISFGLESGSRYLWTLPMFHCNGWTYTWAVTAVGGTHVCLRKVDPGHIFEQIAEHRVTHMCGAPIVLNMLIHAPDDQKRNFEHVAEIATGGAAPPSAVISSMERMGFKVTHLYGLTETYGPSMICAWPPEWNDLEVDARAQRMARQGVHYTTLEGMRVVDTESEAGVPRDVPWDGETIGEIWLRGNTVMKGYLKNPQASAEAFAHGWFHSGDLAVIHPDGYAEVKDRSKDIIISGGENISSLEVEDVLFKHPKIMEAAVVSRPDEKWGEHPCAFVTPSPGQELTSDEVVDWCREHLAHFKAPRTVVFGELPKTSTGKIQKFILRDTARGL
ncbi:MAG: acyl-CoA synthetase [Rhodospirillaceae bacterium]|jgi:fatty-acyl-CoA synthase|nr:acyl-CoA synthetase [Rhodospirillaceae bacterium]MBT6137517.1 acyl-CoA synthetase [Rhodospirillaceae bacterium]